MPDDTIEFAHSAMTLAIVIHVFYPGMWEELAGCVRNFGAETCDIFVTLPKDADESLAARIRGDFPAARIFRIENRGYDVGPFFYVLHEIDLAKYDYVVKLHTKRNRIGFVNYLPLVGNGWRRKLLGFCSTRARAEESLALLASDPSVGMVAHGELIMSTLDEMDRQPRAAKTDVFDFVAGTMFIVRAEILASLKAEIRFEDFPIMSGRAFGFAHACERRFGKAVRDAGKRLAANPPRGLAFRLAVPLARLLYGALMRHSATCDIRQ